MANDFMGDSLALYYGPREQGLATVLPAAKPAFGLMVQIAGSGLARKRKAVSDALKDLKAGDAWRPFMREYQKRFEKTLADLQTMIANGDDAGAAIMARMAAADLKLYAEASKQVGESFNKLLDQARKTDFVRDDAYEQWVMSQLYDDKGQLKDPRDIDIDQFSLDHIAQIPGASDLFDAPKVLRKAADELMPQSDFYMETDLQGKGMMQGQSRFQKVKVSGKLRPYEEYDPATGKVVLKSPDQLIEDGVVDLLMQNPYARRIIEDEAGKRYEGEPLHQALAKATYDLLSEYQLSDGTVKVQKQDILRTPATRVSVGGGGSSKFPHPWLPAIDRALRGEVGDAPAVRIPKQQVIGADKDASLPEVWYDVSPLFGADGKSAITSLPTVTVPSAIDPGKDVQLHAVAVLSNPDSKELMIKYTDGITTAYKRFAPDAKGKKGVSPIYDLIINSGKDVLKSAYQFGYLSNDGTFNLKGDAKASNLEFNYERERARRIRELTMIGNKPIFDLMRNPDQRPLAIKHLRDYVTRSSVKPMVTVPDGDSQLRGRLVNVSFSEGGLFSSDKVILELDTADGTRKKVEVPAADIDRLRSIFSVDTLDFVK